MKKCGCDETYCEKHFQEEMKSYSYLKSVSPVWVLSESRLRELDE